MNADEISKLIESAVRAAIQTHKSEVDKKVDDLSRKLSSISIGETLPFRCCWFVSL